MKTITKELYVVEHEFVSKENRDIFATYAHSNVQIQQVLFSKYVAYRLLERCFHYHAMWAKACWSNFVDANIVSIGIRKVTVEHPLFQ